MYPHALCSNYRADAAAPTRLATFPAPWFHPRRDCRLTLSMGLSGRADNAVHLGKRYAEGSSDGRDLQPRTERRPDEVCLSFRYLGDVRVLIANRHSPRTTGSVAPVASRYATWFRS